MQKWRESNREKLRSYAKGYYQQNKEKRVVSNVEKLMARYGSNTVEQYVKQYMEAQNNITT